MNRNELHDAIAGVSADYITESENFEAVAADFRKANRKKHAAVSILCLAVVSVGVIGAVTSGLLKNPLKPTENNRLISSTEAQAEDSEPTTVTSPATEKVFYSELVKNTEAPALDGYEGSADSLDIVAFDESMLKDAAGVIEGEVTDMRVNLYEYATASDKFEPNGQLFHKVTTVAYTVRVDRVLFGAFSAGDEITVEDVNFMLDPITSVKKGGRYIIPITKGAGVLYDHDEILSGSNILESDYTTLYPFHPQIEKVDGGYVVPGDWTTLVTDECTEIIMDIEDTEIPYPGSLYYVPDDIFDERMSLIVQGSAE